jgi:hypothetical protein
MNLPTLKIGGKEIPLALPPWSIRSALLQAYVENKSRHMARVHLDCAALGLCVADGAPVGLKRGLAEYDGDLIRLGAAVAEALEAIVTSGDEWTQALATGSALSTACFASLAPSKEEVKRARDFSKPGTRPQGSSSRKRTAAGSPSVGSP